MNSVESFPPIAGYNATINETTVEQSIVETEFETITEAKIIPQQLAVEDAELEEEMNLLDFDPMSMISNLGKYATLLEKKKTVIETSDHDCGNTHFFLGNGRNAKMFLFHRPTVESFFECKNCGKAIFISKILKFCVVYF